jgi:hypothetical protein
VTVVWPWFADAVTRDRRIDLIGTVN